MKEIKLEELQIGMVIGRDIMTQSGLLLLSKGDIVNEEAIAKLKQFDVATLSILEESTSQKQQYENLVTQISRDLEDYRLLNIALYGHIKQAVSVVIAKLIVEDAALKALNDLKQINQYTYQHAIHVGMLSGFLGHELAYSQTDITHLILAGLFHDIGKLKIDRQLLNKTSPLSDNEFDAVKEHVNCSVDIVQSFSFCNDLIVTAISQHHEKRDGSGYPQRLTEASINRYAKIVSVADIYDASRSQTCYHDKKSPFAVCDELFEESLKEIDPAASQTLIRFLQKHYIGLHVKLANGEIGEVVFINRFEPNKPLIKVADKFYDMSMTRDVRIVDII